MKNTSEESIKRCDTRIRKQNDAFRASFTGGLCTITPSVLMRGGRFVSGALREIREFVPFGPDTFPDGEHDISFLTVWGTKLRWRIEYYDRALERASADPASAAQTLRVMTIMLDGEYWSPVRWLGAANGRRDGARYRAQ